MRPFALKPRLILHIGAHRTATSALQDYLHRNFDALLAKGFFMAFNKRRHLKLINNLFSGERQVDEAAATIRERMRKHGEHVHTAIITDEDICTRRDLGILAGFRDIFDVKVVYILRRQDTWLESWFLQNIKWQWNKKLSHCTFDEFMGMREDFHWIHYDAYVRHLEDLFGTENVLLKVMEKRQMPGSGPIAAFCDAIGLTDRADLQPAALVNESFSPAISEFMRCLPLDAARPEFRSVLTQACSKVDMELNGGQKKSERLLSHDARVALMAEYAPGNQALAQRRFGRSELFLEPLPPRDEAPASMKLPEDSYALMQRYVAPLVLALIRHEQAQAQKAEKADAEKASK